MQCSSDSARLFAALGSDVRLAIVCLLAPGERCVCEITPRFKLDTSVVSRHLTLLEQAGIIRSRRDGRRVFYRLASRGVIKMVAACCRVCGESETRPHRKSEGKK